MHCGFLVHHGFVLIVGYMIETLVLLALAWDKIDSFRVADLGKDSSDSRSARREREVPVQHERREQLGWGAVSFEAKPTRWMKNIIRRTKKSHTSFDIIVSKGDLVHYNVLSFLDSNTLANCECVSRSWYKMATNQSLWRELPRARHWVEPTPPEPTKRLYHLQCFLVCWAVFQLGLQLVVDFVKMWMYMDSDNGFYNYVCYVEILIGSPNVRRCLFLSVGIPLLFGDGPLEDFHLKVLSKAAQGTFIVYLIALIPSYLTHGFFLAIGGVCLVIGAVVIYIIVISPCWLCIYLKPNISRKTRGCVESVMGTVILSLVHLFIYTFFMGLSAEYVEEVFLVKFFRGMWWDFTYFTEVIDAPLEFISLVNMVL